ncbi:MAG: alpha/beta fold hydrolase [Burkholderiales bacterium]
MKQSGSEYLSIRGLRYHCRTWGAVHAPVIMMLHGWMDVGASFQFVVNAFKGRYRFIAPDLRGFGETQWCGVDSYWFPDYFADLDALIDAYSPTAPVVLVGHSMGGNVASMFTGIRPARVAKLVNVEGFGMGATLPDQAPRRYGRWLDEIKTRQGFRDYASFDELAARLRSKNPRLSPERAAFLAPHWGDRRADGRVELRSDPAHKRVNPNLYRIEEAHACWRAIEAPVLWVTGRETETLKRMGLDAHALAERKRSFPRLHEIEIPAAGHMIHHDQPERLAAAIEDFLRAGPEPFDGL